MAEIAYSIYLKRRRKEQQTISSDLVIVDDTNRFFYKNIIFDLHSLKQVQYSTKQTILVFEDYQLVLEYDQNHIEYFKRFTDKLINIEITVKRRISLIIFILLLVVLSITLFNNIFGIIYMFMGNELIDTTGLYIDIAIIFIVIIAIALIQILKKYHLIIYTTSLIIIGIFIFLPISHIQYTDSDNYQIAYEVHTNQVDVYNDVKYHYGKKDLELEWKDIQEIDVYKNILYAYDGNNYMFYDLSKSNHTLDNFYNHYNDRAYNTAYSFTIEIYDNKVLLSNKEYNVESIGFETVYLSRDDLDYIFCIEGDIAYIYNLTYKNEIELKHDDSLLDKTELPQETEVQDTVEETVDTIQKQTQIDQENYDEYQKVIQQDDIYRVIKELDQEYARINNDEDVELDVQIGSMLIYSQVDNQYGIYIHRSVDTSNAESQNYSQVILMKKYGNDYIGTRFDDLSYMPSVGVTNNGSYNTSTTTDFLYCLEGNKVVKNRWRNS